MTHARAHASNTCEGFPLLDFSLNVLFVCGWTTWLSHEHARKQKASSVDLAAGGVVGDRQGGPSANGASLGVEPAALRSLQDPALLAERRGTFHEAADSALQRRWWVRVHARAPGLAKQKAHRRPHNTRPCLAGGRWAEPNLRRQPLTSWALWAP